MDTDNKIDNELVGDNSQDNNNDIEFSIDIDDKTVEEIKKRKKEKKKREKKGISKKSKRLLIIFGSIILFFGLSIGGYFLYKNLHLKIKDPISAIPQDAAIVLEIYDLQSFNSQLASNSFWTQIESSDLANQYAEISSLLDTIISIYPEILEDNDISPMYLSAHLYQDNTTEYLFIKSYKNKSFTKAVNGLFKDIAEENTDIVETKYLSYEIYSVNIINNNRDLYYAFSNGVFMSSFYKPVVENALAQLDKGGTLNANTEFLELQAKSGKNNSANLYMNFDYAQRLMLKYINQPYIDKVAKLNNFSSWMELDITIKTDDMIFSGYAVTDTSKFSFAKTFAHQEAQEMQLTQYLPYNTSFFYYTALSDVESWYRNYNEYLKYNNLYDAYQTELNSINNSHKLNPKDILFEWMGSEFACFITTPTADKLQENFYAIIETKDIDNAINSLEKYCNPIDDDLSKMYKSFELRNADIPIIMAAVFGQMYRKLENAWFITIDDYIVFSNSEKGLISYINSYQMGKSLANNESYINNLENARDEANLFIYADFNRISSYATEFVIDSVFGLQDNKLAFNKGCFGYQLINENENYYCNAFFSYSDQNIEESAEQWQTILEDKVVRNPYYIEDTRDNTTKIICFDERKQLYLLDNNGEILWKTAIQELPNSDVFTVDCYKNGKNQMLFSTDNYIYIFDLDGNRVGDFPVKLETNASSPVAVFDYENTKNYRLLIACEDNKIYNYDIEGNMVDGWKKPTTDYQVSNPPCYISISDKDYLFFSDYIGSTFIANRRGEERVNIQQEIELANHSTWVADNNKSKFISSDSEGKVLIMDNEGNVSRKDFGSYSRSHYFIYKDFDNDGLNDYIFVDSSQLKVYNDAGENVFNANLNSDIYTKPLFVNIQKESNIIVLIEKENRRLVMYTLDGEKEINASLTGVDGLYIEEEKEDYPLNLIISTEDNILKYILE